MNYRKECNPFDHAIDLETMREMEEVLPMNLYERKSLRSWVYQGNNPETNPWNYTDSDGWPLDYIEAYRRHHGYELIYRYRTIEGE